MDYLKSAQINSHTLFLPPAVPEILISAINYINTHMITILVTHSMLIAFNNSSFLTGVFNPQAKAMTANAIAWGVLIYSLIIFSLQMLIFGFPITYSKSTLLLKVQL